MSAEISTGVNDTARRRVQAVRLCGAFSGLHAGFPTCDDDPVEVIREVQFEKPAITTRIRRHDHVPQSLLRSANLPTVRVSQMVGFR